MDSVRLNFGVIGCGRMGRRRVSSILRNEAANLAAVCDLELSRVEEISVTGDVRLTADYHELLSDPSIDVIVVSAPNKEHVEITIAALDAGKHVFCEKPLARSPRDARKMIEVANKSSGTLSVGSNLRYFPSIVKARELLDSGAIGELNFLRSWIGHQGWNLGESWYSDPEVVGGGTLLDNGCHIFDLTCWFLGEVCEARGLVKSMQHDIKPLEDNGFGIFETVDGKVAMLQSSWTEWNGYSYLEIYGTSGYIRVDNRAGKSTTLLGNTSGEEEVFDFTDLPPSSFEDEFDSYIGSLVRGEQYFPSGDDGLKTVEMAFGIYESSRTGKSVQLSKVSEELALI